MDKSNKNSKKKKCCHGTKLHIRTLNALFCHDQTRPGQVPEPKSAPIHVPLLFFSAHFPVSIEIDEMQPTRFIDKSGHFHGDRYVVIRASTAPWAIVNVIGHGA